MFEELQKIGPSYDYFPEPTKSILVIPPEMVDRATEYLQDHHFKITTGSRDTLEISSDPEVAAKNMSKIRY
jgi:hypothetical protein